jgi:fructokinase
MKKGFTIVGLGEVLWDLYPDVQYLGGAPANATIHANRLGANGIVVSAVGQDRLGDALLSCLKEQMIETRYIQRIPDYPTGTVLVQLDANRIPQFTCSNDVAFDYLRWNDSLVALSHQADAVLVGTLAQRNAISHQTIQTFLEQVSNGVVVFDVNFRGWNASVKEVVEKTLVHTDILKMNETEMQAMQKAFGKTDQSAEDFLGWLNGSYQLKLAVLSLGSQGCLVSNGTKRILSPGVEVNTVDTTGCGDGFVAGLVMKYLEGSSLEEMAKFANYLGAFVATKKGAVPEYSIDELMAFMQSNRERAVLNI